VGVENFQSLPEKSFLLPSFRVATPLLFAIPYSAA